MVLCEKGVLRNFAKITGKATFFYRIPPVDASGYCLLSRINKKHVSLTKKVEFVLRYFVAADKINTVRLLNKNTLIPRQIMVLPCVVNFEQF